MAEPKSLVDRGLGEPSVDRVTVSVHRALVINQKDRVDRLESFAAVWNSRVCGHLQLTWAAFPAVPAASKLLSCLLSHQAVLASGVPGPILILEDDAVPADPFTVTLLEKVPADWEILWLGGQHKAPPVEFGNDTWNIPTLMLRTHAYVVRNPSVIAGLLAAELPPAADPYLSQLPVPQYSLRRFTVGQAAGVSSINGLSRQRAEFWNTELPVPHGV